MNIWRVTKFDGKTTIEEKKEKKKNKKPKQRMELRAHFYSNKTFN